MTLPSFLQKLHKPTPGALIACAFSGLEAGFLYTLFSTPNFLNLSKSIENVSIGLFLLFFALAAAGLCIPYVLTGLDIIPAAGLFGMSMFYACVLAYRADESAFLMLGIALIIALVVRWCLIGDKLKLDKLAEKFTDYRIVWGIAAALFVIFTVVVAYATSRKYATFSNFTFDFGIFAQMFENMARTGLPVTTLERSVELSHFAVHFSPIYYLALPGYFLFRSPYYLFWVQAAVVGASIFPVVAICKKLGQSPLFATCAALITFAYPALSNACFYDFHENKFLTVCLLWMLYFILSEKIVPTFVFAALTLSVKEDAALYVFAVALWMVCTRKGMRNKAVGAGLFAFALGYFFFATKMIELSGGEIMMSRLSDYLLPGEDGFGAVAKNVLLDFSKFLSTIFTSERIAFVIWMLGCVMFAPFFGEGLNLLLLSPILVINLMQSWTYQYDINYQYSYGVAALILVCAVLALVRMKAETRKFVLTVSVCLCLIFSCNLAVTKMGVYNRRYKNNKETYAQMEEVLSRIPRDASVTATGSLCPHLFDVKELHTLPDYYGDHQYTDYYVLDTRYTGGGYDASDVVSEGHYVLIETAGYVEVYIFITLYTPPEDGT